MNAKWIVGGLLVALTGVALTPGAAAWETCPADLTCVHTEEWSIEVCSKLTGTCETHVLPFPADCQGIRPRCQL